MKEPGKTIAIVEIDITSALVIPLSSDFPKMWVKVRLKRRGVLIGSLSVAFAFEINTSQLRAGSGGPSLGRASRSQGTCTLTIQASPSTEETYAACTPPGVCASPPDSTSGTSRSFLVNTVVFFPLALRQRTHRNATPLSRY